MGRGTLTAMVRGGLAVLLVAVSLLAQQGVRADDSPFLTNLQREALLRFGIGLTLYEKRIQAGLRSSVTATALIYTAGYCATAGKKGPDFSACIAPQRDALELTDQNISGFFELSGTWSFAETFTHTKGKMTVGDPSYSEADVEYVSLGTLEAQGGGKAQFQFYESGDGFDFKYGNTAGDRGHGYVLWVPGGCSLLGIFQSDVFFKDGIANNGVIAMRRC